MSNPLAALKEGNGQGALIWSLEITLVVVLSFFCAKIFWTLFGGDALLPEVADAQLQILSVNSPHRNEDIDAVLKRWHPFGKLKSTTNPSAGQGPVTAYKKGDLALIGLFASNNDRSGWAIIASSGDQDHLYFVGQKLPGGATLSEVDSDSVLLDSGGERKRLKLQDFSKIKTVIADTQSDTDTPTPKLDQHDKLINKFGLKPVSPSSAAGYIVTKKAILLMQKYNLKVGDEVLSVNGYPVGDKDADQTALAAIHKENKADVLIQRGGQQIIVNYRGNIP